MVAFEDDEPANGGSGEDSQEEDETMEDADGEDAEDNGLDATMVDDDADDAGGDEEEDADADGEADEGEDDDDGPDSPTQARRTLSNAAAATASTPSGNTASHPTLLLTSPSPRSASRPKPAFFVPSPLPEAISARSYEIVPTMASPQSTSINAIATTPDMRWVFSGGADGYVRMYNWVDTVNGKVPLTVAQKHPFVDSVMKAGSLTTYWENEDAPTSGMTVTPPRSGVDAEPKDTSPVHALAVHHEAVWLLSGSETGAINLQTCRHQAGTRISTLKEHTSAVSALVLSGDEMGVLSGSWDKRVLDWDLNVGRVRRTFPGSGGQISALEMRPNSGIPVPEIYELKQESDTFSSNNAQPLANGARIKPEDRRESKNGNEEDALGSPDGSLFGENDHGSLFGDGDDAGGGGGGAFGGLDDDDFDKSLVNGSADDTKIKEERADPTDALFATPGEPEPVLGEPTEREKSTQNDQDHDMATIEANNSAQQDTAPDTAMPVTQATPNGVGHDLGPNTTSNDATTDAISGSAGPSTEQVTNGSPSTAVGAAAGSSSLPASMAGGLPPPPSETTFLDAAIDGMLRIWDKRQERPIARISPQRGTPPWCMGACWSPDGNTFYAGRRNGTVDEYSVHRGSMMGEPMRTLRLPQGSGAVSAVRAMPNGRGLVCASHDILRVYDLKIDMSRVKPSVIPFLIVPGHRTGVISAIHVDPSCRFMISAAGNRGWEGSSTEVLLGYEIGYSSQPGYLG